MAAKVEIPPVKPKAVPYRDIVRMLEYQTRQRIEAERQPKRKDPPVSAAGRRAHREMRAASRKLTRCKSLLRRLGYQEGYNNKLVRIEPRGNDWHAKRSARLTRLVELRTRALIDLIGRTPQEMRTYLQNLQTVLRTL